MYANHMSTPVIDRLIAGTTDTWDGAVSVNPTSEPPKYTQVVQSCRSKMNSGAQGTACYTFCGPASGVANIRIEGDDWSMARLFVGDKCFATIHSPRYGHSFFLTDGGNCLPLVEGTQITLHLTKESGEDPHITYDYVDCDFTEGDFAIQTFQNTGLETVVAGDVKVRTALIFPVEKLIVDVLKGQVDAMQFCCRTTELITLPFEKVSDTQFVLDFGGKDVNFTNLVWQALQFVATDETIVDTRAITRNIVRIHPGSYELVYWR
jgi:hypothetical protein